MAINTLASIIEKVRRLTGSANSFQLTDADIKDYINSFYLYDFPAQFRSLKLKDKLTFDTVQGIDTYPFDTSLYTTVEMPCYCMKREIALFNEPWSFYGVNFNWQQQTNFTTGNGGAGPYSGNASAIPILRSVNNDSSLVTYPVSRVQNILITANTTTSTLNVTDDGNGNLIGDCLVGGTIDYQSGAIAALTFTQSIPQGNQIQIQYNPFQASIPLSILFFQNQFTLRPVPDRGYTIELITYRLPSQALTNTGGDLGTPEILEWWETLAYGASKKIYQDRLDTDGVAIMDKFLADAYSLNETRTYAQLGKQRISTIYADQLTNNYGSGYGWGAGGGAL